MPPRRITKPSPDDTLQCNPPDLRQLIERTVRTVVNNAEWRKRVETQVQPMIDAKFQAMLHERVIPKVGSAPVVFGWIERAGKPFATKEEWDEFIAEVRWGTGDDEEFVFWLEWGMLAQREGENAPTDKVLADLLHGKGDLLNNSTLREYLERKTFP
jgi:hypothetical protein